MQQGQSGHVQKRLVDAELLYDGHHLFDNPEYLLGNLAVPTMVRGHQNQLGAEPFRPDRRHSRMNSERSGLIRCSRDDTPVPTAANRDRPGPQGRIPQSLALHKERIHINVNNWLGEPHVDHTTHAVGETVTATIGPPTIPTTLLHSTDMANLIHLVRHAEVLNPEHVVYAKLPNFGLSERGLQQATDAARYLSGQPLVAIWSSPLERALQTAALIGARHSLPVRVDDDLTEWALGDLWAGIVWEDLPEQRPGELEAYLEHPWDLPFSPESLQDLGDRMVRTIKAIHARHSEGDVVIVSHQDPVQVARLILTGTPLSHQHIDKPMHGTVHTFQPSSGWEEAARYDPENQEAFPPA